MRIDNMIMNIKRFCLLAVVPLLLSACEVGLGEKVDVYPPSIKVASPENTEYVQQEFTISGTAHDDSEITSLSVTLEPLDQPTSSNTYKFRLVNKIWEFYDNDSETWTEYDTSKCSVSGTNTDISWSLTYQFDSSVVSNGTEYQISTQVFDQYGNESKASKDERSITVDTTDPVVTLISPAVTRSYSTINADSASYELNDNTILTKLINGEFTVSGSQKEEGKLAKLIVYLDDRTDNNVDNVAENALMQKTVTGDNLRNWSATFRLYEVPGYENDKKIVRIVTESHDQAGNVETVSHGWFVYYNDADKPWVVAGFGGANGYSNKTTVYPNCSLQGQAYDDDGLKSITIRVYKENETTPESESIVDLASENFPKYRAWSVKALSVKCNFRIEATCVDKNNLSSETVIRYMEVKDINPPEIKITTDTAQPMLGDEAGNVTLNGYVTDDGGIKALKLVRLKNNCPSTDIIKYYTSGYTEWGKATVSGFVDENGNKIWTLPLVDATSDIAGQVKKSFTREFNIFTDFGINGTSERLKVQNFIIMAVDEGDVANIDSFTWAGDTVAPELSIKELYVNGTKKIDFEQSNSQGTSKMLTPFNRDSASGNITDKIKLTGTWSDNSTSHWTDKTKHSNMTVTWDGVTGLTVTFNSDGTWITNEITPPDATTAIIGLEFSDYAGNVAKANENFFVSSNDPELLRITALENDGSFKAGDSIHIVLEFNKSVTFSGGSTPSLTLNVPASGTKKTVDYDPSYKVIVNGQQQETNGTTSHVFTYTVSNGEDIPALDVDSISSNGNTWKSTINGTDFFVSNMTVPASNSAKASMRLKSSRTLCIDTVAPTFTSLRAITSKGSYGKDKDILIQATLSEDVTIGDVSKIKLTLEDTAESNTATVTTTSAMQTGSNTILFTYKVADGKNFSGLKVRGITLTGATVKDTAKNQMNEVNVDVPSDQTGLSDIKIDTTAPGLPVVTVKQGDNEVDNNAYIYSSSGVTVTFSNFESDASIKKYSIDGGSNWVDVPSNNTVNITANGDYTITAYQVDAAGNLCYRAATASNPQTNQADSVHINIDAGNILTSVSAGKANGTYTTENVIPIYLNFRKAIKVSSNATLTLNNGKTAVYDASNSSSTRAVFNYTVVEGDSSATQGTGTNQTPVALNVSTITGTFTDEHDNNNADDDSNVTEYCTTIPAGKNLINARTIYIITGRPYVTGVNYSGTTKILRLTFNNPITKVSGNITITHGTGYRAPSVLTVDEYNKLIGKNSSIADYYEKGTNGYDNSGNPDTEEKYILKFANNITDGNATSGLTYELKQADADKVIIPINSSYVTVNGKNLLIELKDSYALPVIGASYNISLPQDLVVDKQNHKNLEDLTRTFNEISGVEKPVIRIEKKDETITVSGTNMSVAQPLTASVKVECQTPGITPSVSVQSQTNTQDSYSGTKIKKKTLSLTDATITQTSTNGTIGMTLGANNFTNGYVYKITATATKNSKTETATEYAYRTVYTLTNAPGINEDVTAHNNTYTQLYARGGDKDMGGLSISTFPVSWNTAEYNKMRAMTNSTGSTWYWVTWKINVNAYIQPLRGNVASEVTIKDSDGNEITTYCPERWCWGMQGPIPTGLANYILYPGQSLSISGSTDYKYGAMSFYKKHCEYRSGQEVIKEMQP